MPGAHRILDNPVPVGQLLVTDFEFAEVRGGAELPQLNLVAYSLVVALVGQEVAVVVIEDGGDPGGSLGLDNAPGWGMFEEVLLAGSQDFRFVEIARSHFPRHERPTEVVY